ncbi:MAG: nucleotidyltransferase domain-containing protein [Chloroflexi bacterium]|nr:nucleotidyltransferase domain-containing protein [Chloroflexota bacterium]
MWEPYGATLYVFGSRVRGTVRRDSDYDIGAVSDAFAGQHIMDRALARQDWWIAAGGWRIPLDLHPYTPDEFHEELRGLGYLGQAKRRGELVKVPLRMSDDPPAPLRDIVAPEK